MTSKLKLYKAVFAALHGDAEAFRLLESEGYVITHQADFFKIAMMLFNELTEDDRELTGHKDKIHIT